MSAIPYGHETETEWAAEEQPLPLPGGRQRRRWGRPAVVLLAVLTAAVGFYAGVRVEKGQVSSSTSTGGLSLTSAARTGASGSGASSRGGFAGLGALGGNTSIGTISTVKGKTIHITETSGTVKVTPSSATKITKSLGVSKKSLHPGDSVVIQGATSSTGTISATSVSDSGASSTGSGNSTGRHRQLGQRELGGQLTVRLERRVTRKSPITWVTGGRRGDGNDAQRSPQRK
ncbi:MAG TPA: hypothetical protein VLW51_01710 [Solirubrobacteraceae bacterium]|nr:hypothetical protein [Solirubrobacteraceae bacterium]